MPSKLQADTVGPVDVAVIGFEGNHFTGDIAPALLELQGNGTVRILDLSFVSKDGEGAVSTVEVSDSAVAAAFAQVTEDEFDLLSDEDLKLAAEQLPLESSALVVAWENTWAARLARGVRDSQGRVLFMERVPHDDVVRAITALDEEE
ncbi:DUF6325 family protein [Streptomyces boninensis]|uniref:DUF6325 family protein n=1 Tax=Streptomyces boninensis TaxID=2039455 RepID=UPI003B21CBB7